MRERVRRQVDVPSRYVERAGHDGKTRHMKRRQRRPRRIEDAVDSRLSRSGQREARAVADV
jgi:hypothetical protein